jgi:hypothetical protein
MGDLAGCRAKSAACHGYDCLIGPLKTGSMTIFDQRRVSTSPNGKSARLEWC